RLSAQWDWLEKERNKIDFTQMDWFVKEAEKRNAKIIMVVGQKTPRWPECHVPEWADNLQPAEYKRALTDYITKVVERYKKSPALEIWQVENEPYLDFGITCANYDKDLVKMEVAEVKKLDPNHKTMVTDSGELSWWTRTAKLGDLFGTTMYRVVWSKTFGYWNYDWLPPSFYRLKLWLNGRSVNEAFISELQAEPWIPDHIVQSTDIKEQFKSMDLNRLKKNISFAQETGFPRAYLWGAEWWYWLHEQGYDEIPEYVKNLKKE
ncbi:MAG: beta-galactosidase, partial [bacterium]